MTGNDRESRSRRKSSSADTKMAAQSQGIKQLMAAEKEAAQVVANARKSECGGLLTSLLSLKWPAAGFEPGELAGFGSVGVGCY